MYVKKHTPNQLLDKNTPKEDFSGEKPEVIHMRIFSSSVYIHIPKEKRTKIDPFRRRKIFIGYNDTSNSYQIYFQGFKKIDISRDVNFDEESSYFKSRRTPIQEVEELQEKSIQEMEIGYK